MRSKAPALLPILRSQHLAELLAYLLMHPDEARGLSELSGELDIPLTTVQTEVRRLIAAGLVESRKIGRTRLVKVDRSNPAVAPLTELLSLAYGPRAVVRDEFSVVSGVERVVIFGSWAARFSGEEGPPPRDIDVLLIGEGISQIDSFAAADRAQGVLKIPVNPVQCSPSQWAAPGQDALLAEIVSMPYVEVLHLA